MTTSNLLINLLAGMAATVAVSDPANASFTLYNADFTGWQAAAGSVTTVDFVENGPSEWVLYDHFVESGVLLHREGSWDPAYAYWVRYGLDSSGGQYTHDGGGIWSSPPEAIAFRFLSPMNAFAYRALSYAGGAHIKFYRDGSLIGSAQFALLPAGGIFGAYSTELFDEVRFSGSLRVDDIYFQTVPTPGAFALLAVGAVLGGRRRRV